MSTIEIRDIRECTNELVSEELQSIHGGANPMPMPDYPVPDTSGFPHMESIEEMLENAYAQFPEVFPEMPGHPGGGCFPYPKPADPVYFLSKA